MRNEGVTEVWLSPYLPIAEEVAVGPWILIPFDAFRRRHARSRGVFNAARVGGFVGVRARGRLTARHELYGWALSAT